jgi:hypothetical protein
VCDMAFVEEVRSKNLHPQKEPWAICNSTLLVGSYNPHKRSSLLMGSYNPHKTFVNGGQDLTNLAILDISFCS